MDEELNRFKGVVKCLMKDAMDTLEKLEETCNGSPSSMEEYNLLKHYLDYTIKLCKGKM